MSTRKILRFALFLVSFLLIFNLARDVWRLKKAEERIAKTREKLEEAEEERQKLEGTRKYYQSDDFLEEQIRNKLGLAKQGETILILPEEIKEGKKETLFNTEEQEKELENWQKWLELFK